MWDSPIEVVFVEDGAKLSDPKLISFKCDISKYIRKYQIKPPKNIATLPDSYIQSQKSFFERGYLEILELCNKKLDARTKDEKKYKAQTEYVSMFTADGK